MAIKGIIFDLDGTLIVNMQYHLQAWEKFVTGMGGTLQGAALFKELYGKNEEVVVRLFGNKFTPAQLQEYSLLKETYYRDLYVPHIKLIAGAEDFFKAMQEKNIPMAIATASMKLNVDIILDTLNIRQYFKAVITADDVTRSKPHPESFLKAAAGIGVASEDCIVFEDVPKGVLSAANAGMAAIVVTTSHTKDEFEEFSHIVQFIADFTELDAANIF